MKRIGTFYCFTCEGAPKLYLEIEVPDDDLDATVEKNCPTCNSPLKHIGFKPRIAIRYAYADTPSSQKRNPLPKEQAEFFKDKYKQESELAGKPIIE